MIQYDNLIGQSYVDGKVDCYQIIRDFYKQNFNIDLPNYARPKDWWNLDMDLYMQRYFANGFRAIDVHPSEYELGDVFLISYMAKVANHAGILVDNGRILHHFTNRLSSVDPYRGIWKNNTVAVLRHKDVVIEKTQTVDNIINYVSPTTRQKINNAIDASRISQENL